MSSFWDTLTGIFDAALAPSCAQDPASDAAAGSGAEWHNSFGTAADYQVPAEVDYAYSTVDSCGWNSGGGFDSIGGSGMDF